MLEMEKKRKRPSDTKQRQRQFLRQFESTAEAKVARHTSLLDTGHDGELSVDLDRKII